MLPASFREIHKLRSGNALKLTQPYDFSGRLERFTQNAGLTRHRHAAHHLKGEVDPLTQGRWPGELKSHAAFAHVGELAPIVFAKKHQHHVMVERFPGERAPLPCFCIVFRNCR